jgi:hypothetical protein
MGRKRSFESLEERRLLANVGAALASAAPAPPMIDAASALPAAADVSATPPASSAASQNPSSSADPALTESPNEYASPTGSAASNSSATPNDAAPNSYETYANEYSPSRTYSYGPNNSAPYYTPAQTAAITSLAAALEVQSLAGQTSSPVQQFAPVASVTSGASPSGEYAASGVVSSKPSDLVVRSESQSPLSVARPAPAFDQQPDELANPITLLSPGGQESAFSQTETAMTALEDDSEAKPAPATPLFGGPLAGSIAANLELIERGVDALFERLEGWSVEWASGAGPRRLGQALVAAAGAAAAWEYARARYREAEAGRMPYDWRAPREPHLSRRRPARRRGT